MSLRPHILYNIIIRIFIFILATPTTTGVYASFPTYVNEFIDPNFLLNSSAWIVPTPMARNTIIKGAGILAASGPWSMFYACSMLFL
jgi:hypothetical protein